MTLDSEILGLGSEVLDSGGEVLTIGLLQIYQFFLDVMNMSICVKVEQKCLLITLK